MKTYARTIAEKLNDLLKKTYDAEKGYGKAADNVKHPGLKSYFERKATERYKFGHDLETEIKSLSQEVNKDSGIISKASGAWLSEKTFFASATDQDVIEEVIRGEKEAVEEYNDVLKEMSLPKTTVEILSRQRNTIEKGLLIVSNL